MLTLFSLPKPFRGHIDVIQRNALRSWTLLDPRPEVILFGDDYGTSEVARDFSFLHVPAIARNAHGTPLIGDMFAQAQRMATHDVLCYVNADILLMSDFTPAIRRLAGSRLSFLMVGQRWDMDVTEPLTLDATWEDRLRADISRRGVLHAVTGIDYFAFQRGMWGEIPPFAIGRSIWDEWLLFRARRRGAVIVDATEVVTAVHQNHDYRHISTAGTWDSMLNSQEALVNQKLGGGPDRQFTLYDANLLLTPKGLVPATRPEHVRRAKETRLILFSPWLHDTWKRLNTEWGSVRRSRSRLPERHELTALALRIRYFSVRYAVRRLLSRPSGVDGGEDGR